MYIVIWIIIICIISKIFHNASVESERRRIQNKKLKKEYEYFYSNKTTSYTSATNHSTQNTSSQNMQQHNHTNHIADFENRSK